MKALVALLLLVAVPAVVLYAGWRRGRFVLAFAAVVVLLLGIWGASLLAVATDYRDADGHMDCWPSCTALQHTVNVAFWLTIPALALLSVAAAAALAVSTWRRRAARRPG